jgi:hypothetical protein
MPIKPHLQYLSYVLRHKWFVMRECFRYRLYWRGITHDLTKFLPCEWFPYVNKFYGPDKLAERVTKANTGYFHAPRQKDPFNYAWLHHLHHPLNSHHWQHWLLVQDDDDNLVLEMPLADVIEMVCDWRGAGRAQGKGDDVLLWYREHEKKMKLHPDTRWRVEDMVDPSRFDDANPNVRARAYRWRWGGRK